MTILKVEGVSVSPGTRATLLHYTISGYSS
nr:MAG TPA: hypothetical protein [Caudoviricetes sp.]